MKRELFDTTVEDTLAPGEQGKNPALILAGGGLKVAFQAGVLQVLLNEARDKDGKPLRFPIADGTSGGTFNLAMFCQGLDGQQIADNWRAFRPFKGVAPNLPGMLLGPYAPSMFTFDKYRKHVFSDELWDLRWDEIHATNTKSSFNVYNFTEQKLESRPAAEMDEDLLVACNSLPFWFPPVKREGATYLDGVFITDANLEWAIVEAHADDLVVIWTVSQRSVWRDGFVAQYFQTIEETGNGVLERILKRIEASNAAIKDGRDGEFDHLVNVRIMYAEVPLHYIMNFRRDRMRTAVELGVREGRKFLDKHGFALASDIPPSPPMEPKSPSLEFSETMRGTVLVESPDPPPEGSAITEDNAPIALHLHGRIEEIGRFVADPDHVVTMSGSVDCASLGGNMPILVGELNLLTFEGDPGRSFFNYRLQFEDSEGEPMTLFGVKFVIDGPRADLWSDTTTLHVDVWPGFRETRPDSDVDPPIASGQVRQTLLGFLTQQLTMKTGAKNPWQSIQVRARFYAFFLGRLFDVYGQKVLANSPF